MTTSLNNNAETIIQPFIGAYPVTPESVSLFYYNDIELFIDTKDPQKQAFPENVTPINILTQGQPASLDIQNHYIKGLITAFNSGRLPAIIIVTSTYPYLTDFINEFCELVVAFDKAQLLKPFQKLFNFYFPVFILLSEGVILDKIKRQIKPKLLQAGINERLAENTVNKIIRGNSVNLAWQDENTYHIYSNAPLKLAIQKPDIIAETASLLKTKGISVSIQSNSKRTEFEKVLMDIVINILAINLAVEEKYHELYCFRINELLNSSNQDRKATIQELWQAVFKIGQKHGAFAETDKFEVIIENLTTKHLGINAHLQSNSIIELKCLILNKSTGTQNLEHTINAIIEPLKKLAKEHRLSKELSVLEKTERAALNKINFIRKNQDKMSIYEPPPASKDLT